MLYTVKQVNWSKNSEEHLRITRIEQIEDRVTRYSLSCSDKETPYLKAIDILNGEGIEIKGYLQMNKREFLLSTDKIGKRTW